nr:calmodulin binding protein PICBP-like [Ipomoea batatas]
MAVEPTFSESLAGRNKRETAEPKRKPRSVISFPRLLCSSRSLKSRPPAKSRFRCLRIDPSGSSGGSSPEKSSPVQMPGASPHFMKGTACYDAKKESFQGGIECDDVESVDSSISVKHESKTKNLKGVRKGIKSFGSTRSFRRGRSRIMKPTANHSPCSVETSEDSSLNQMKAASCSERRKGHFLRASTRGSESSFDSSDQSSQSNLASSSSAKSFQTLMRSSSLRSLRVSFKSRRRSVKVLPEAKAVDTATCSSTIKNSKFPEKVELLPGQAESERISVHRVCSYHHCSLNGHSHDSPSIPPKRVHPRRRWSTSGKSTKLSTKELIPIDGKLGVGTSQISSGVDPLMHKKSSPEPTVSVTEDSSVRENSQSYADLVEIIFGETSFPEKNYQETLNQMGKTANWCCSCNSSKANVDSEEFRENQEEISEPDKGLIVKPTPAGELESKNLPQVVDSEAKSSSLKTPTPQDNKEKQLSMWNLIQHHMVSGLAAGSNNKPLNGSDEANHADDSNKLPAAPESSRAYADVAAAAGQDGENQEIEVRKLFAIKLVREAIEKILLPEVPDQSSDDQSITSETTPDQEILERSKENASAQENYMDADTNQDLATALPGSKESESSVITDSNGSQGEVKTRREVAMKSERKAPKHWSNLKKWILLQRFIKELEKVKKISPRKPRQLPLENDPEAEKVHLRPQVVDEKRRTEEWMLDYALRQAVSQLAPTQRRKVELLVRAFETVVPPQGGNNIEVTLPKFKSNSEEHLQMTTKENKFSSEENETIHPVSGWSDERCKTEELDASSGIVPSLAHQFDGESPTVPGKQNKKAADAESVAVQGSHEGADLNSNSESPTSASIKSTKSRELDAQDGNSFTNPSILGDGSEKLQSTKNILEETERKPEHQPEVCGGNSLIESMSAWKGDNNGGGTKHLEKRKYISMWHMISQHVLTGVVSKAGTELLDGADDEVEDAITVEETKTHRSCQELPKPHDHTDAICENVDAGHQRRNFSRDDAIKLVREVVNEILVTQVQDDSSDTQSVTSDTLPEQELPVTSQIGDGEHNGLALSEENLKECNKSEGTVTMEKEGSTTINDSIIKEHEKREVTLAKAKPGLTKSKNWSKLKKLLLLKRSIMALESARKLKFPPRIDLPQTPSPEPEKVDLRPQMVDERKKAEQWMLDYAVQNMVTKLTPARKRRVAMLVEAFEAVVPLPEV